MAKTTKEKRIKRAAIGILVLLLCFFSCSCKAVEEKVSFTESSLAKQKQPSSGKFIKTFSVGRLSNDFSRSKEDINKMVKLDLIPVNRGTGMKDGENVSDAIHAVSRNKKKTETEKIS